MNLLTSTYIQQRLDISRTQAWRLFGKGHKGLLPEQTVIEMLNAKAVNMQKMTFIPGDLSKPENLELSLNGKPINSKRLIGWLNNPDYGIPHIRFSSHLIRLSKSEVKEWVKTL